MAQQPAASHRDNPHAEDTDCHRIPNISGGGQAASHDDIHRAAHFQNKFHKNNLASQGVNHRVVRKNAVNGVAEEKNYQC